MAETLNYAQEQRNTFLWWKYPAKAILLDARHDVASSQLPAVL